MNRNFALSLVLAAAAVAGNAVADDITPEPSFVSTLSRAEVQAELQQSRGGVDVWAQDYDQLAGFRSERSREDVIAEFTAEREMVAAMNGEDGGSMQVARQALPAPIVAAAE